MPLSYHQALFELLGRKPRVSRGAVKVLKERERLLGVSFPASLKELYSIAGISRLFEESLGCLPLVPIEDLGNPEDVAHGAVLFKDVSDADVEFGVRLDGSDDPPVDAIIPAESPADDDVSWWEYADVSPAAKSLSAFLYELLLAQGGNRRDRTIARKLKPYGGSLDYDDQGRADRVWLVENETYINGILQPGPRPFDAFTAGSIRRLDRAQYLFIQLSRAESGTDTWRPLRDHPALFHISDWMGIIDEDAVEHLIPMPALRELQLCGGRLADRGLRRLLEGHKFAKLWISSFRRTYVDVLDTLQVQTDLETLSLESPFPSSEPTLIDADLARLEGLTSLRDLRILSEGITDEGVCHLAGLTNLEHLQLLSDEINDAGLAHLASLTGLKRLDIGWSKKITETGFRHIAALPALAQVNLCYSFQGQEVPNLGRIDVLAAGHPHRSKP